MKYVVGSLEGSPDKYLMLFTIFDKAGVPQDSRWRSLLLYFREVRDYVHLSDAQKIAIQKLLAETLDKKDFSEAALDAVLKEYRNIIVKPFQGKVDALIREATDVISGFQAIMTTRCSAINSLEEEAVCIVSEVEADTLESIAKLRTAFSRVKTLLEEDIRNLEQMATCDGMTGLANRRGFDMFMDTAIVRWLSEKRPLCLALLDIDHFKLFNDKHGHRVGDQVLSVVGAHLKNALQDFAERNDILAARYGGEEFALAISGPDAPKLVTATEQCRRRIKSFNFLIRDASGDTVESGLNITISAGVASAWEKWRSQYLDNLVENADKALYFAKQSGRDRTVLFHNESDQGFSLVNE